MKICVQVIVTSSIFVNGERPLCPRIAQRGQHFCYCSTVSHLWQMASSRPFVIFCFRLLGRTTNVTVFMVSMAVSVSPAPRAVTTTLARMERPVCRPRTATSASANPEPPGSTATCRLTNASPTLARMVRSTYDYNILSQNSKYIQFWISPFPGYCLLAILRVLGLHRMTRSKPLPIYRLNRSHKLTGSYAWATLYGAYLPSV